MKIIVNIKNYTPYKYDEYIDGGSPQNNPYIVGQVVAIKEYDENGNLTDKEVLGVVLGCISKHELRTDVFGMVSIEDIRPANVIDFTNDRVVSCEKLSKECAGFKVDFNWENHELKIEDPKQKYYQPRFNFDETLITPEGIELWSYYVYSSKELAQNDFPDREILEYSNGDIEEPYFVK